MTTIKQRTTLAIVASIMATVATTAATTIVDASQGFLNRTQDQTVQADPTVRTYGQTFTVPEGTDGTLIRMTTWVIPPNPQSRYAWNLYDADTRALIASVDIAGKLPFDEADRPDILEGFSSLEIFASIPLTPGHSYLATWTANSGGRQVWAMADHRGDTAYPLGTGFAWERALEMPLERDLAFSVTFGPGTLVPEGGSTIGLLTLVLAPLGWLVRKMRQ